MVILWGRQRTIKIGLIQQYGTESPQTMSLVAVTRRYLTPSNAPYPQSAVSSIPGRTADLEGEFVLRLDIKLTKTKLNAPKFARCGAARAYKPTNILEISCTG